MKEPNPLVRARPLLLCAGTLLVCALLGACGQKGPLRPPDREPLVNAPDNAAAPADTQTPDDDAERNREP